MDNAVRAAGPEGRIHLNVHARDGLAVLDLWDSGPGVPPSEREHSGDLVCLDPGGPGPCSG